MRYLGIDIGGTFIKYALLDEQAQIFEKSKVKTPLEEGDTLQDFMEILEKIITTFKERIDGIAISAPSILEGENGRARTGGALHYLTGTNLVQLLEERFDLPVSIQDDGKSAALAELWKGNLKGCKNGAVMLLGTAVGGGLVLDGKLYSGSLCAAGEFSFMALDDEKIDQEESYFGTNGGVPGLLKLVSQETKLPLSELDGVKVFEMANRGDERVLVALQKYTRRLAVQMYNLQALLDLDIVAIGGGISQQPLLLSYIQKNITECCECNPAKALAPFIPTPTITTCRFYNDSNLIGALYHHLQTKNA